MGSEFRLHRNVSGYATIEEIAAGWLNDLLQMPAGTGVGFVTGATMANFVTLAAARHALLNRSNWDVEERGLFGAPEIDVVVGEEVHVSVKKALSMLGMGRARVIVVPADAQGAFDVAQMPALRPNSIVCIQAGNVNTGAFDPAATAMRASMSATADYLIITDKREPCEFTPEMSRRARGVEVWAALRHLGRNGLAEMVERCCRHAARFADGLREAGFEILNDVVLNQVLVSFGSDERTREVIERLQEDGTCWCGGTVWKGRAAMRISVSSWVTTEEDVEMSVAAIVAPARERSGAELRNPIVRSGCSVR